MKMYAVRRCSAAKVNKVVHLKKAVSVLPRCRQGSGALTRAPAAAPSAAKEVRRYLGSYRSEIPR